MIPLREKHALVLFSGGQDSATCLAWALNRYGRVETLGFDYGQRHRVELDCRTRLRTQVASLKPEWAARLADDHLLPVDTFQHLGQTAMTGDVAITMQADGLPNTFVPGRNLIFLTFAAALAYRRNLNVLIGGMTEADYSGYPDCRDNTIKALQVALSLGMERQLTLETPLMWLDKTEIWELAWRLGGDTLVETIRQDSHTCYLGTRDALHCWGYGCGSCPACTLRARGYVRWAAQHALR
ncbi:7-cyano-7-deazaguanine synthase QueC [Kerstersia sp.]|uniref:7-cyano-7-deazaguanine synthase QueC n=1 Tax=Kerstersia sp. TaxID=1930783 RepID=UPI003F934840